MNFFIDLKNFFKLTKLKIILYILFLLELVHYFFGLFIDYCDPMLSFCLVDNIQVIHSIAGLVLLPITLLATPIFIIGAAILYYPMAYINFCNSYPDEILCDGQKRMIYLIILFIFFTVLSYLWINFLAEFIYGYKKSKRNFFVTLVIMIISISAIVYAGVKSGNFFEKIRPEFFVRVTSIDARAIGNNIDLSWETSGSKIPPCYHLEWNELPASHIRGGTELRYPQKNYTISGLKPNMDYDIMVAPCITWEPNGSLWWYQNGKKSVQIKTGN